MRQTFLQPRTPCFWHYDILFGLKVMAEAGFIQDPRCQEALDVLEAMRLPDGGFPAEGKYYSLVKEPGQVANGLRADFGPTGRTQANPFITIDALFVLKAAGRET